MALLKASLHSDKSAAKLADLSNVNWALLDQALISGANFVLGLLLVRYIGLSSYGEYVLTWMVVQFSMSIQNALIVSPMFSIAPQVPYNERCKYYSVTLILQLLLAGICAGLPMLYVVVSPERWLPTWLNIHTASLLSLCIFVSQFQDYCRRKFCSIGQYRLACLIDSLAFGIQILFIVFVMQFFPTISSVLVIFACSMAISIIVALKFLDYHKPDVRNVVQVSFRHWRSAKWLLGSAFLQWVTGNYYLITAGILLGPIAVGAIRAAQNLVGLSHILFQAFENIAPKEASRRYSESGWAALVSYMFLSGVIIVFGTATIAVFASYHADTLYSIFYKSTDPAAVTMMLWFVPIYILIAAQLPLRAGLRTLEQTKYIFLSYLIAAAFSLCTAQYFVSNHNVSGVMLGLICVESIMILVFALGLLMARRRMVASRSMKAYSGKI